jgi:hypothetical protein
MFLKIKFTIQLILLYIADQAAGTSCKRTISACKETADTYPRVCGKYYLTHLSIFFVLYSVVSMLTYFLVCLYSLHADFWQCPPVCPRGGVSGTAPLCPPSCFRYSSTFDVFYKIIRQVCCTNFVYWGIICKVSCGHLIEMKYRRVFLDSGGEHLLDLH